MIIEYRVQRNDLPWGRGQGHYVIAKTGTEAKKIVAGHLKHATPKELVAKPWKKGISIYALKRIK